MKNDNFIRNNHINAAAGFKKPAQQFSGFKMAMEDSAMQVDDDEENDDDNSDDEGEVEDEEMEEQAIGRKGRRTGRGVTLSMLLAENILHPGEGLMTIDYLGKKFIGDLMPNGKIRWQETRQVFNSPSAWAIFCKKLINPDKKSGCGWASVKFKGKKLDFYKSAWFRKHRPLVSPDKSESSIEADTNEMNNTQGSPKKESENKEDPKGTENGNKLKNRGVKRPVVNHSSLGIRSLDNDPNTLVDCTPFSTLGKIQPFTVTLSTNCLFLMDFHCHLTTSEVVGYLAGTWDIVSHNLAVLQAFPCKCRLGDKESVPGVEEEIRHSIDKQGLSLLGWYHSHPTCSPNPTLRDISCQMDYQIKLKGNNDASYTPCLGIICSPYCPESGTQESQIQAFWVMPPQENKPLEYGKPMLMNFTITQDFFAHEVMNEMRLLHDYYKEAPDMIDFDKEWENGVCFRDKLKNSLLKRKTPEISEHRITEALHIILGDSNS